VGGIDDHRQVGHVLDDRRRRYVERVPSGGLKGSDPSLDQDDLVIPLLVDVLGGIEPLIDGGRETSLEHHRLVNPTDL